PMKKKFQLDHWTAFTLLVSLGLVSLLLPDWTRLAFLHLSQPILIGLALMTALHLRKPEWNARLRWALLSAAVGVTLVCVTVPSDFRVLSDEANLVGSSWSLLYSGHPLIPLQSRWSFDRFWVL